MINRPTAELQKFELSGCGIGEWISARDAPWRKPGMHEYVPPGQSDDALPWFFYPIYDGPNLLGWERVE